MTDQNLQQILNFIQDAKNDFYSYHDLENDEIEVLMPSLVKYQLSWYQDSKFLDELKNDTLFNLKINNHYLNEVVVYHNGTSKIEPKILKLD